MGTAALTLIVSLSGHSQTAPAFDVASIHPSGPEQRQEGNNVRPHHIHITPGNVVIRNAPMREIVSWAYNVAFYQIAGPDWVNTTSFEIVAKAPSPATEDEMRPMMRTLLATRFGLTAHTADKEMNVMALLQAKDGAKLTPSKDDGESVFQPSGNGKPMIHFGRMSMQEFATLLSEPMQKPVIDMTGLEGTFDFTLDASNYVPPPPAPGQPREREDESYMVIRALQDEVGLRLEPRKLTIKQVVIDHLAKTPTEN